MFVYHAAEIRRRFLAIDLLISTFVNLRRVRNLKVNLRQIRNSYNERVLKQYTQCGRGFVCYRNIWRIKCICHIHFTSHFERAIYVFMRFSGTLKYFVLRILYCPLVCGESIDAQSTQLDHSMVVYVASGSICFTTVTLSNNYIKFWKTKEPLNQDLKLLQLIREKYNLSDD